MEQFYWYVDDHTLLARQMPISVTCLKPERVVTGLECFWDYGLISECAPNTKPFVFRDSDDFLMMELRGENTYSEYLTIGWPTPEEIAADLGSFVTKDHVDYGRHTLVVHSRDLPPSVSAAEQRLSAFVDRVYASLPAEPRSWRNHQYWQASVPEFERARAEWRRQREATSCRTTSAATPSPAFSASVGTPETLPTDRVRRMLDRIQRGLLGDPPRVKPTHPQWGEFRPGVAALDGVLKSADTKTLIVTSGLAGQVLSPLLGHSPGRYARVDEFSADNNLIDLVIGDEADFDLCLIELDFADLLRLPRIYRCIRPRMKVGAKVVAYFTNNYALPLERKNLALIRTIFPATDTSRISFSSSQLGHVAKRLLKRGAALRARRPRLGTVAFALIVVIAVPLALIANRWGRAPSLRRPPKLCTSMTVELEVC
jgi:hypothetical protein